MSKAHDILAIGEVVSLKREAAEMAVGRQLATLKKLEDQRKRLPRLRMFTGDAQMQRMADLHFTWELDQAERLNKIVASQRVELEKARQHLARCRAQEEGVSELRSRIEKRGERKFAERQQRRLLEDMVAARLHLAARSCSTFPVE